MGGGGGRRAAGEAGWPLRNVAGRASSELRQALLRTSCAVRARGVSQPRDLGLRRPSGIAREARAGRGVAGRAARRRCRCGHRPPVAAPLPPTVGRAGARAAYGRAGARDRAPDRVPRRRRRRRDRETDGGHVAEVPRAHGGLRVRRLQRLRVHRQQQVDLGGLQDARVARAGGAAARRVLGVRRGGRGRDVGVVVRLRLRRPPRRGRQHRVDGGGAGVGQPRLRPRDAVGVVAVGQGVRLHQRQGLLRVLAVLLVAERPDVRRGLRHEVLRDVPGALAPDLLLLHQTGHPQAHAEDQEDRQNNGQNEPPLRALVGRGGGRARAGRVRRRERVAGRRVRPGARPRGRRGARGERQLQRRRAHDEVRRQAGDGRGQRHGLQRRGLGDAEVVHQHHLIVNRGGPAVREGDVDHAGVDREDAADREGVADGVDVGEAQLPGALDGEGPGDGRGGVGHADAQEGVADDHVAPDRAAPREGRRRGLEQLPALPRRRQGPVHADLGRDRRPGEPAAELVDHVPVAPERALPRDRRDLLERPLARVRGRLGRQRDGPAGGRHLVDVVEGGARADGEGPGVVEGDVHGERRAVADDHRVGVVDARSAVAGDGDGVVRGQRPLVLNGTLRQRQAGLDGGRAGAAQVDGEAGHRHRAPGGGHERGSAHEPQGGRPHALPRERVDVDRGVAGDHHVAGQHVVDAGVHEAQRAHGARGDRHDRHRRRGLRQRGRERAGAGAVLHEVAVADAGLGAGAQDVARGWRREGGGARAGVVEVLEGLERATVVDPHQLAPPAGAGIGHRVGGRGAGVAHLLPRSRRLAAAGGRDGDGEGLGGVVPGPALLVRAGGGARAVLVLHRGQPLAVEARGIEP